MELDDLFGSDSGDEQPVESQTPAQEEPEDALNHDESMEDLNEPIEEEEHEEIVVEATLPDMTFPSRNRFDVALLCCHSGLLHTYTHTLLRDTLLDFPSL